MYLHLGVDSTVRTADILGIFDLDNSTTSRDTRDFLRRAEKAGRVANVCGQQLPKSFLLKSPAPRRGVRAKTARQSEPAAPTVYLCQISAATLKKRSG